MRSRVFVFYLVAILGVFFLLSVVVAGEKLTTPTAQALCEQGNHLLMQVKYEEALEQ